MDWSIHVSNAAEVRSDLSSREIGSFDAGSKLGPVVELTWRLIGEYFGAVRFTRCAYGNEFCEHLIPTPQQLGAVVNAASRYGIGITLLTPYVSDAGIELLKPLFEMLSENGESEVVFNDWGVMNVLNRAFP